jgi:hypothetical protein
MLHVVKKYARDRELKYEILHAWLCQNLEWLALGEEARSPL